MMQLKEIRNHKELTSVIDWEMTPEEAVTRYLEWGNNWSHGKDLVRSKNDFSRYFVVNTWDIPPKVYFIQRNSQAAVELAVTDMPNELSARFMESVGHRKGVYAINEELKAWLEEMLYGPDGEESMHPIS
jgi:hypothetical protein